MNTHSHVAPRGFQGRVLGRASIGRVEGQTPQHPSGHAYTHPSTSGHRAHIPGHHGALTGSPHSFLRVSLPDVPIRLPRSVPPASAVFCRGGGQPYPTGRPPAAPGYP